MPLEGAWLLLGSWLEDEAAAAVVKLLSLALSSSTFFFLSRAEASSTARNWRQVVVGGEGGGLSQWSEGLDFGAYEREQESREGDSGLYQT